MRGHALVLGIGNTLLGDEGVGVHAVNRLNASHPQLERVTFLDGGTLSFSLAVPLADAEHFIVVDAAEFQAPPGSVRVWEDDAMDDYLDAGGRRSVHEVGLLDLMAITRLSGRLPTRRALVGVQPGYIDWAEKPSAVVNAALPRVCDHVLDLITKWRQ